MTGPLAGEPRERKREVPTSRRVRSWLVWWVLMLAFWVIIDDSVETDELLVGAGAAALAALVAELVTYQAAARFQLRIRWLVPALRLPGQVARDMVIVYGALWRRLARGEQPSSAFLELPARFGDDSAWRRHPPDAADRRHQCGAQHVRPRHRFRHQSHGRAPAGGRETPSRARTAQQGHQAEKSATAGTARKSAMDQTREKGEERT